MNFHFSFPFLARLSLSQILFPISLLFSGMLIAGPPSGEVLTDHVYDPRVRTVQFYQGNFIGSFPVIYMDRLMPLTLEFDELISRDDAESRLYVELINCDVDWEATYLLPIEFFDGISQDPINIYRRSEYTRVDYVHYRYSFPQEREKFKMSGNYILKVYRNPDRNNVVLTRRFVVVERSIPVRAMDELQGEFDRRRFSELKFEVFPASLNLYSPGQDIKVRVLQNFRWESAFHGDRPRFASTDRLEYYLDLTRDFYGGNEFRKHDIRSLLLLGENVADAVEKDPMSEVILRRDGVHRNNIYDALDDMNGAFVIAIDEWPDPAINADYVLNHFSLDIRHPYSPDDRIYLMGSFTDWQLQDQFEMQYNPEKLQYETSIMLKQGVYNYVYVVKNSRSGEISESRIEGRRYDGENFYTVLVYFRGPIDRSDRIVGFLPVNYIE